MQRGSGKLAGLDKRAQVALFVIIAIVLVAVIVLLVFLKPEIKVAPKVTEPQGYIEKCIKDASSEAIDLIGLRGGSLEPYNYANYAGNRVSYLCYSDYDYAKCVNQQPMLKYSIENEITSYSMPKVQNCISQLKSQLEKMGYSVTVGSLSLTTSLQPKKVIVDAYLPLTITKEETKTFDKFESVVLSPIYDQAMLAQDIVNSEINYGDFEQLSYMLYHQNMDIDKKMVDENNIYILTDRGSGKQFIFAIRNYVMPAGF